VSQLHEFNVFTVSTSVRFAVRTSGTVTDNPQKCNYSLLSTPQN